MNQAANLSNIKLTGIIIENPLFDPLYQRFHIDYLARELGIIDDIQQ